MAAIPELLPAAAGEAGDPASAKVFKIERGASGEKIAYLRMFAGTIRTRDKVSFRGLEEKVTSIAVFERGQAAQRPSVSAGSVAKVWGLRGIEIGDRIGDPASDGADHQFPPPTLESVVVADDPGDRQRLRAALAQLTEQDPLINVRQDDDRQEISVSLYGEVQKEVIEATLADDFGIAVVFRETTPIYVERPVAGGEAIELLHADSNPFLATIGLRVGPAAAGSGIEFRMGVGIDHSAIPLYIYRTAERFATHMSEYVRATLQEGLFGWQVTDCIVTMTSCTYSVPDGPPSRRGPLSTAADFRKLTPLVLMQALDNARTVVCEPIARVSLEVPPDKLGAVSAALARLGANIETPSLQGELALMETTMAATRAHDLQRQLPGLTGGEGVLESSFAGYQPVTGDPPCRQRTTANPLNLSEYMAQLAGRATRPNEPRLARE